MGTILSTMATRSPPQEKSPGPKKARKPGSGTHVRVQRKVAQLATQGIAPEPKPKKLTPSQQRRKVPHEIDTAKERIDLFVNNYLVTLNQTEAYLAAGFKPKASTAPSCASEYMRRPEVVAAIKEAKRVRAEAEAAKGGGALTKEKVLGILNRMLDHDPRKMFKDDGSLKLPHEMDDSAAMVLTSFEQDATYIGAAREGEPPAKVVTKKVKTSGRDAPLQLAMRHLGMLDDKLRLVVTGSVKVHDMARLALLTDEQLNSLEEITRILQGVEE